MLTMTIEQAQAKLAELIHGLTAGEEVVITENNKPLARIVLMADIPQRQPRQPGTLRGTVRYMAPVFNAPLADFQEYMA